MKADTVGQEAADGLLPVLRELCRGAGADGSLPLTPRALHAAREAWGAAALLRLSGIARVLGEVRLSRRAVFHYSNPDCPCCRHKLTPNERAFLSLVRAGIAGQKTAATGAALILTEGGPVEPARNAALALRGVWSAGPV
ncbi:hypothetical protein [Neotabrizicola shimadae]|uniref:Uncharacterized protein n=1 Tax=Neotabrizicola shimadae TaxID=2807096 RepID=A0A8G0ZYH7_9RHOB|nr:hypothetical protein [Neotabrizicola shimadae]QYZ71452.1 hypothetical protein JO391_08130 [Neotabrizicola shimadae]